LCACQRAPTPTAPAIARDRSASPLTAADHGAGTDSVPGADGFGRAAGIRYLELIRGAADASQPLPMVVMIHGLGDRPRRELFDLVAVQVPARIILPQAPTPIGDGYSWFDYHVGENDPQQLAQGIAAAEARLALALSALRKLRPTVGRPVVAGFSQGGMLSFALALRHPQLVAFAQPISGTLPEPLWPQTPVLAGAFPPIRALHGTADHVVPIDTTRRLVAHLRVLGYDASLIEFAGVDHAITAEMQASVHATLSEAVAAQR
jgi:phospholipase/carboxylesterase